LAANDLGGTRPRRIHYWPMSGKVKRLSMPSAHESQELLQQEENYSNKLKKETVSGDIELW
jgi:chemotaxis protein CheD